MVAVGQNSGGLGASWLDGHVRQSPGGRFDV